MFKVNAMFEDEVCLQLFSYSVRRKAKQWLSSLPQGLITTWSQLAEKFLTRYFPPAKISKLWSDIYTYKRLVPETFYDT